MATVVPLMIHNKRQTIKKEEWCLVSSVALVRTDVSEEPGASFIRVTRIGDLGTTQAATSNRCTLRRNFFAAYVGCQANVGSYKSHAA
jgi:hypothetical protein